jgi:hydroxymethylpyrimidine/phosphomethylpyrimidine kinase
MTGDRQNDLPVVLTVAGFDPSGGAGIIADIKTLATLKCRPVAAITALTFQNSNGVFGAVHMNAESLRAQILPMVEEFQIAAIKTGMLPTQGIVLEVGRLIRERNLPSPVIDPVLRSTSGYELMEADAIDALIAELMPLARLITPNIPEAEKLTGLVIEDEGGMRAAASRLREMGARAVLIKGGHLKQRSEIRDQRSEIRDQRSEIRDRQAERGTSPTVREGSGRAIDLLDDNGTVAVLCGDWIDSPPVRGTGCMLSAAIAACLAQALELQESVRLAKQFVADAIRDASRLAADP